MRAARVQASLRIRTVSPELLLLAHTSSESRGTFRQKARSLTPLSGWACAVKIYHDGMLEDTNWLDGAQLYTIFVDLGQHKLSPYLETFCSFQQKSCRVWLYNAKCYKGFIFDDFALLSTHTCMLVVQSERI